MIMLAIGKVKASTHLHNNLLNNVLQSPMLFFEVTPVGRILNRFSKDTDVVDANIPGNIRIFLNCLYRALGTCFVVSLATPYVLVAIVAIGIIYLLVQVGMD